MTGGRPAESSSHHTHKHTTPRTGRSLATGKFWVTPAGQPRVEYLTPSTYLSPRAQGSVQFLGNYQIFELHYTQLVVSAQTCTWYYWLYVCWMGLTAQLALTPHRSQTCQLIQPNFLCRHSSVGARSVRRVNNIKLENYTQLLIPSIFHQKNSIKIPRTIVSDRGLKWISRQ